MMSFRLSDIGIPGKVYARDLWAHKDLGALTATYSSSVPRHGVVVLRLSYNPMPTISQDGK